MTTDAKRDPLPTPRPKPTDPPPEHDPGHYATIASQTAAALVSYGHARVWLEPGDMTRYKVVIVRPGRIVTDSAWSVQDVDDYYAVTLMGLGRGYPWNGYEVHWTYAAEKWADGHEHTGRVLAAFLTALAGVLALDREPL